MATQIQDNSGLYFIVGALVVVVAIIGFLYLNGNEINLGDTTPTVIERTVEKTTNNTTTTPTAPSSSLELKMDRDGASATTKQE